MKDLTIYLAHLPTCNLSQDWTEAQVALADCPEGPDKAEAYNEMTALMNKCTCGMVNVMDQIKILQEHYFTPDQIAQIQTTAYEHGYNAGRE